MTLDPATLSALATSAVTVLVPLLQKAVEKGAEELGKATAGSLFEKLKKRLTRPAAQEALQDLAKAPQDETHQDIARGQITKTLKDEPEFAAELAAWLKEAGADVGGVTQVMTVSGSGNRSAQLSGSGNSVQIG